MGFLSSWPLSLKVGILLVLILLLVAFIVKVAMRPSVGYSGRSQKDSVQLFIQKSAQRYQKSLQDAHYVHAFNDINQAIAYLNSARAIASTDEEIQAWTNVHPKEWRDTLDAQQASIIQKMQAQCPNPFTETPANLHAGWSA